MALEFTTSYLADAIPLFRHYKKLGEGAMRQVTDAQLFQSLDDEGNSMAVVVKHMSGNMLSRWTDFLTTDGEKSSRDRDAEFEFAEGSREVVMKLWESGWACLLQAIEPLMEADLSRTVMIRGEAHSVLQTVNRQLAHYPYHVGQIVLMAKHFAGPEWETLSVAKGASTEFNRKVAAGEASQR